MAIAATWRSAKGVTAGRGILHGLSVVKHRPLRWIFMAASLALVASAFAGPSADKAASATRFRFEEATIDALQSEMKAGRLSARELTAAYLQRIADIDRAGPTLRAVIEINPDALSIATQLDAERKAGRVRGPLHGIPVLLKDNIATGDRMETTAGSLALVGAKPPGDAHLVTRLREAGAVILGKTNLSEWALFRDGNGRSGWSARGGQTLNPYALDLSPSGSSSGAAVAVAANLCVVAVGTETDGSIVSPASACGIVGIKPTVGLVSRGGLIPISASQDTAGVLARTVRDAGLVLGVLAGVDPQDSATLNREREKVPDFTARPRRPALRGARLGVVTGPFGFDSAHTGELNGAIAELEEAGAVIACRGEFKAFLKLDEPEREVLLYEFKDGINRYLATLGPASPMKSLADLIAFNEAHAAEEMPYFKQQIFILAQAKGPLTDPAYRAALAACRRIARTEGIDALMRQYQLDALVSLTGTTAWRIDRAAGGPVSANSAQPAAVAGYPSISVPAALIDGLPVGLTFYGRPWSEARLLDLAADFEARTQARRVPGFLPPAPAAAPPVPAPTAERASPPVSRQ